MSMKEANLTTQFISNRNLKKLNRNFWKKIKKIRAHNSRLIVQRGRLTPHRNFNNNRRSNPGMRKTQSQCQVLIRLIHSTSSNQQVFSNNRQYNNRVLWIHSQNRPPFSLRNFNLATNKPRASRCSSLKLRKHQFSRHSLLFSNL